MPSSNGPLPGGGADNGGSKEPEAFRASVLVIDDEPAFCFAISEILGLAGLHVRQAFSVDQAMEELDSTTPDLILTDVMMPGVDGLSFLRRLRGMPDLAAVPTIAVSAKSRKEDIAAAEEAGADSYLVKPFSARQLHEVIRPYLPSARRQPPS